MNVIVVCNCCSATFQTNKLRLFLRLIRMLLCVNLCSLTKMLAAPSFERVIYSMTHLIRETLTSACLRCDAGATLQR